jgi:secreted trypsin-like serine protease
MNHKLLKPCFFISYLSIAWACGSSPADPSSAAEDQSPIIGGRIDRAHDAIGLVGVASTSRSRSVRWQCTGTLIGAKTVLTAAHCVTTTGKRKIAAGRMRFATADAVASVERVEVISTYAPGSDSAWDDIALLILKKPSDQPALTRARTSPIAGEHAEVIGYGVTIATGPHQGEGDGVRRYATIQIADVTDHELDYDASQQGACYGDSGGPILQDLGAGEVVIGVTSRGTEVACDGADIATRVDAFDEWIRERSPDNL